MEEKKKHKYTTHITFYENAYCPTKKSINYVIISVTLLFFTKQVIVWDLLMMKKVTSWRKEPEKLKKKKNPEKSLKYLIS